MRTTAFLARAIARPARPRPLVTVTTQTGEPRVLAIATARMSVLRILAIAVAWISGLRALSRAIAWVGELRALASGIAWIGMLRPLVSTIARIGVPSVPAGVITWVGVPSVPACAITWVGVPSVPPCAITWIGRRAGAGERLGARAGRVCLLLVAAALSISGAQADATYPAVVPGYTIELPRDEGSHPAFKTEWWYVTGWLQDSSGSPLGFQLTFFRSRTGIDDDNPSRFALRQVLFAHLAISDPKRGSLIHHEKSARPGFGLAAAAEDSLDVYIDDWRLRHDGDTYTAVAKADNVKLDLKLQPKSPPLLQGDAGFSQKGPNPSSASYYYSLPQLAVTGSVSIEGEERTVKGIAWFDHEWSGAIVDERAQGWDWIGLNLDDGGALMMFQMRGPNDTELWAAAKYRPANSSEAVSYKPDAVEWKPLRHWRSPRSGVRYPVEWQVTVGSRVITLRPLMDDQENDASGSTGTIYWEGAVLALENNRVIGRGYLELTGYGKKMRL